MRAAIFKRAGQPLAIEERPDPVPGDGEVVLKVHRCGICGTDLHMTDGHSPAFGYAENSPLGHEFAGEVVALGRNVDTLREGDRISALPFFGCGRCATCLAGRPNFCSGFRGQAAGFAEYMTVRADVATRLPALLSMDDGALVEPMAVGLHGVALARLAPGAKVLVIGAGPVGLAAVFWACRLGAGCVAVTAPDFGDEDFPCPLQSAHVVVAKSRVDGEQGPCAPSAPAAWGTSGPVLPT